MSSSLRGGGGVSVTRNGNIITISGNTSPGSPPPGTGLTSSNILAGTGLDRQVNGNDVTLFVDESRQKAVTAQQISASTASTNPVTISKDSNNNITVGFNANRLPSGGPGGNNLTASATDTVDLQIDANTDTILGNVKDNSLGGVKFRKAGLFFPKLDIRV